MFADVVLDEGARRLHTETFPPGIVQSILEHDSYVSVLYQIVFL